MLALVVQDLPSFPVWVLFEDALKPDHVVSASLHVFPEDVHIFVKIQLALIRQQKSVKLRVKNAFQCSLSVSRQRLI